MGGDRPATENEESRAAVAMAEWHGHGVWRLTSEGKDPAAHGHDEERAINIAMMYCVRQRWDWVAVRREMEEGEEGRGEWRRERRNGGGKKDGFLGRFSDRPSRPVTCA